MSAFHDAATRAVRIELGIVKLHPVDALLALVPFRPGTVIFDNFKAVTP